MSKRKFPVWIIVVSVFVLLFLLSYLGVFSGSDDAAFDQQPLKTNGDVCDGDSSFECGGDCFSCDGGAGYKLCCNSASDNWCCPVNEDCDYVNKDCKPRYVAPQTYCGDGICNGGEDCSSCSTDCGICKDEILSKVKNAIVWVKYDVTGKNRDGSYFEGGVTGSGVIVANKDNELTIYTNRHVVDCEYNDIDCFQRITENVQVRTQDGMMRPVDRVSFSKSDIDLAILAIKTTSAKNYDFAYYTDHFAVNDPVTAVGYPAYAQNVVEFSISSGRITNIKDVLSQSTGIGFKVIESDAYTYFGSSGGGLFDENGNLVGINTWGATRDSIAIAFDSISEEGFVYCDDESYFADGACYNYCDRDEVMGYKNRACYAVCDEFYCNSQQPPANDQRCEDAGYILGSDGYCHLPCSSSNSYCNANSICLNNNCYAQCAQGYLWEDGSCRYYE